MICWVFVSSHIICLENIYIICLYLCWYIRELSVLYTFILLLWGMSCMKLIEYGRKRRLFLVFSTPWNDVVHDWWLYCVFCAILQWLESIPRLPHKHAVPYFQNMIQLVYYYSPVRLQKCYYSLNIIGKLYPLKRNSWRHPCTWSTFNNTLS